MTIISNFREFEEANHLHGKITLPLAESLAEYFAEQEGVNEAGVMDTIKNTLSKTFLGSLSHIGMIDKLRAEILKGEKELLVKKYAYDEEVHSLKNSIRELAKSKNQAGISTAERTVASKENEFRTYNKVTKTKIDRALKVLSEVIKGNKRRMEYWDAGKSEDELELAEFEYKLAKDASASVEEISALEKTIADAKNEVQRTQQELENRAKKAKEDEEDQKKINGIKTLDKSSIDYRKLLKSKKGRADMIAEIEHEIVDLKKEITSTRNQFEKKQLERKISNLTGTKEDIEKLDKKSGTSNLIPSPQEVEHVNKIADDFVNSKQSTDKNKGAKQTTTETKVPEFPGLKKVTVAEPPKKA